jgi:hypothetical protein
VPSEASYLILQEIATMHGVKVLIVVIVVGVLAAAGLFALVPSTRPAIVKKWFRQASGFTPAKTPTEALDKFRDAIKKRDYETAADYCDNAYREQVLKVAPQAKKLGEAIDSLLYNMQKAEINSPKTKTTLKYLEPFPTSFSVLKIKEVDDKNAVAFLGSDEVFDKDTHVQRNLLDKHANMMRTLVPIPNLSEVELVKEDTGFWKIKWPVTPLLRVKVDALKNNATNYANALNQVRDEVKNNPTTKEGLQTELERRLNESK